MQALNFKNRKKLFKIICLIMEPGSEDARLWTQYYGLGMYENKSEYNHRIVNNQKSHCTVQYFSQFLCSLLVIAKSFLTMCYSLDLSFLLRAVSKSTTSLICIKAVSASIVGF